jgi:archaemetzincin
MNINLINLSRYTLFFFREGILPSLTAQQRNILKVVSIIFGFFATLCIAKYCYFKIKALNRRETKISIEKKRDAEELEEDKKATRSESFEDTLKKQMAQAKKVDNLAPLNGWKKGLGCDEKEQTLEAFKSEPTTLLNVHRTHLKVVIFGEISQRDREIMKIVCEYLQTMHVLETTLDPTPIPLYNVYIRQNPNPQYPIEPHLEKLKILLPQNTFLLGFTDQDLYPYFKAKSMNFVFGAGDPNRACGFFSTYRMSTNHFDVTLKRLMKLASHELSHMRGITHCTQNTCTMQGTNTLQEGDQVPMTFCTEDMAKICHLNHWSLKKGYEKQLYFFETFSQHYGKDVDFSQEITHLKKKIAAIETIG